MDDRDNRDDALRSLRHAARPHVDALLQNADQQHRAELESLCAMSFLDHSNACQHLDTIVGVGFQLLTSPLAHAEAHKALRWRWTFALAALLRARQHAHVRCWGNAARLLDMALLLGPPSEPLVTGVALPLLDAAAVGVVQAGASPAAHLPRRSTRTTSMRAAAACALPRVRLEVLPAERDAGAGAGASASFSEPVHLLNALQDWPALADGGWASSLEHTRRAIGQ